MSNIYDQPYHEHRGEKVERCLTVPFRRDLFRCLEAASGREVIVLSSPPKAVERRTGKWLPPVETRFSTHRQWFCGNWDVPKLRVPLSWFFYARHVLRHVRSGDVVVIDNYEFLYIVAARLLHCFRRVTFVLVYLDGKHLIDRSWSRVLSWLAESWGRTLFGGALLSNPELGRRLPNSLPMELVPGFVPGELPARAVVPGEEIHLLYAGLLTRAHGIDLLLEALPLLPEKGWRLTIAGEGPLAGEVASLARDRRWSGRVEYRPAMPPEQFTRLLDTSHIGLNCQRISAPISSVTFPSKTFTYLAAGLLVVSSKSGCVTQICGGACLYYEEETPQALAATLCEAIANLSAARQKVNPISVTDRYSFEAAATRIREMFKTIGVIK